MGKNGVVIFIVLIILGARPLTVHDIEMVIWGIEVEGWRPMHGLAMEYYNQRRSTRPHVIPFQQQQPLMYICGSCKRLSECTFCNKCGHNTELIYIA